MAEADMTLEQARGYGLNGLNRYLAECERNQATLERAVFEEIKKVNQVRRFIAVLEEEDDG